MARLPHRRSAAGLVLGTLILVAAVANLNLAVANVALPSIGLAFDASQTALDLVAVGYSLGLATSVLYLGALGDRYGRKRMLVGGMALSIPACILAAVAPSIEVLFAARLLGGVAAGMAFPTTLALITALWSGPERTRSIALWSGIGGAIAALGPVISGALLSEFDWESVFIVTLPLAHPGPGDGAALRARPRQRDHRSGGQPRGIGVGALRRRSRAGHQLRARAGRRRPGHRARASSRSSPERRS